MSRKIDEFDKLWTMVKEQKLLPFDILDTIPDALSEDGKKKLAKMKPEDAVAAIRAAIDKINAGSMETIDTLVQRLDHA